MLASVLRTSLFKLRQIRQIKTFRNLSGPSWRQRARSYPTQEHATLPSRVKAEKIMKGSQRKATMFCCSVASAAEQRLHVQAAASCAECRERWCMHLALQGLRKRSCENSASNWSRLTRRLRERWLATGEIKAVPKEEKPVSNQSTPSTASDWPFECILVHLLQVSVRTLSVILCDVIRYLGPLCLCIPTPTLSHYQYIKPVLSI